MNEQWKDVVGYEGHYQVSDYGNVRRNIGFRCKQLRILKPDVIKGGYLRVPMYRNAIKNRVTIHRLVMAAFVGPCPSEHEVNHKNGDAGDNRLSNLEYMTRANNNRHAYRVLNRSRHQGSSHPLHKLTESDIPKIIALRQSGETCVAIGAMFGVCNSSIGKICKGRTWKHTLSVSA